MSADYDIYRSDEEGDADRTPLEDALEKAQEILEAAGLTDITLVLSAKYTRDGEERGNLISHGEDPAAVLTLILTNAQALAEAMGVPMAIVPTTPPSSN